MQDSCLVRTRPPSGGYITIGTLILAGASAVVLVLLSGCHSTPPANGFTATPADKAAEQRLRTQDAMTPIQPFDEGFVVLPKDATAP